MGQGCRKPWSADHFSPSPRPPLLPPFLPLSNTRTGCLSGSNCVNLDLNNLGNTQKNLFQRIHLSPHRSFRDTYIFLDTLSDRAELPPSVGDLIFI